MNDIALTLKIYKINKHATEEEGVAIVYLVREFRWCDANGSLQANILNAYVFILIKYKFSCSLVTKNQDRHDLR